MKDLNRKINEQFPGLVVRKDLTKLVKGNAIVPSYVLEYLLGQYCATDDENTVREGVEKVKDILAKHYVHRNEAGLVRSTIRERGRHKVIDKVTVDLNEKTDQYEARFTNLGIKQILVEPNVVKKHPRLLVGGVWCIVDLEYEYAEGSKDAPWILNKIKPIQVSHCDMDALLEARRNFTMEEWIDALVQTIGFEPEQLNMRQKLFQIIRLIPYCERNYNVIELGPKGTGKSHQYSEFSPHGILISGGEVTVPKLFVNNSNGKIGLVGYWDCIGFDEFAGKAKKVDKSLIDILKNYLANKSFSRGTETIGAEASMAFIGNTRRSLPYMLKHTDLFEELPEKYRDTAFLDRIHYYIPGWEVAILRSELFTTGYGFIVDYYAEVLKFLRNSDFSLEHDRHFELDRSIAQRDRDGVLKTFSGLMKLVFPHRECTQDEMRMLLEVAMEGRKRVKSQLLIMDETYSPVNFAFTDKNSGDAHKVMLLEERQYPSLFANMHQAEEEDERGPNESGEPETAECSAHAGAVPAHGEHRVIQEHAKGVTYDDLFGPCLNGARNIEIKDPYIRLFYQVRNMAEFLQVVLKRVPVGEEAKVKLVTKQDPSDRERQEGLLQGLQENMEGSGVVFEYEFCQDESFHARSIETDTGWKIALDRGLDIYQPFDMKDAFNPAGQMQELRPCKHFEVTYLKEDYSEDSRDENS